MIRFFEEHEAEFAALLDGYWSSDLDALGIDEVVEDGWLGRGTYFVTWSEGNVLTSIYKGYIHSESPLNPTVDDTEGAVGVVFHPIGDGWYVFWFGDP